MSSPLYQQIILFLVLAMVGAIGVLLLERLAVVENVGDENENPAPNGSEQA